MSASAEAAVRVLLFGSRPVPPALSTLPADTVAGFEAATAILAALPEHTRRIIVVGDDADLAHVLTRLLRTERLDTEIGFVPPRSSRARRVYQIGIRAARRARDGRAQRVPLIRDDTGTVLVGRASWTSTGPGGVTGEATVDDTLLFSGVASVDVEPTASAPGVRASVRRWPRRWVTGRAVQLGAVGALVRRDGVADPRPVKRSTFYRNQQGWLLVR